MTLKCGIEVTQGQVKVIENLKVVPFESLGMISNSPPKVTMAISLAISEIFSVKEWHDIEIWG